MDTHQAAMLFLDSKRSSGRAKATIALYSMVLLRFSDSYVTLPSEPEQIEKWMASIDGQPETRHVYFRTLRTFYSWLDARHQIPNPTRSIEAPRVPGKLPRFLTPKELRLLLEYPHHSKRDRALLYFLVDTGVRSGEAASLLSENIKEGWAIVTGKRGQRFVPMSPVTQVMLAQMASSGPVWHGFRGPLTSSGIQQAVKSSMKSVGLQGKKLGPHLLRHTFATLWNGEELVLQNLLGHSSLHMTKRYRQLRVEHITTQHTLHSPLKHLNLVAII